MTTLDRTTYVDARRFHAMRFAMREEYRGMLAAHGFPPGSRVVWSEITRRPFRRSKLRVSQRRRSADGTLVLADGGQLIEDITTVRYRGKF